MRMRTNRVQSGDGEIIKQSMLLGAASNLDPTFSQTSRPDHQYLETRTTLSRADAATQNTEVIRIGQSVADVPRNNTL